MAKNEKNNIITYFIFIEIQYYYYLFYFNNCLEFKKLNHVTSRPKG